MTRLRRPGKEKDVDPPSKPAATKKRKTTIDQVHVLIPECVCVKLF
ncbi:hypothetical protein HanXRQr2_Chr17g0818281 [Helianthus annuus]|uniref:Uncharacterized protein n=1 Tax=Helianthus annuus TaxID=4232 RepID=A0A9K3DJU5_HELAN|nr:hypothetical protein HanXRQr2_Chr17g0818281 [Helianthus annuus]